MCADSTHMRRDCQQDHTKQEQTSKTAAGGGDLPSPLSDDKKRYQSPDETDRQTMKSKTAKDKNEQSIQNKK